MPKSAYNKDAKQLYWSHTLAWLFSCKFAAYFPNTSFIEHLWVAASLNIGIDSKFLLLLFFESEVNEILKFSPDNCLRWFENKKANWINTCDLCDSLRMIQLLVWIQHKMGVSYMRIVLHEILYAFVLLNFLVAFKGVILLTFEVDVWVDVWRKFDIVNCYFFII